MIGPKFIVPAYAKISMMPQPTEEDSSDEELEYADAASGRAESPRSPFLGISFLYTGLYHVFLWFLGSRIVWATLVERTLFSYLQRGLTLQ